MESVRARGIHYDGREPLLARWDAVAQFNLQPQPIYCGIVERWPETGEAADYDLVGELVISQGDSHLDQGDAHIVLAVVRRAVFVDRKLDFGDCVRDLLSGVAYRFGLVVDMRRDAVGTVKQDFDDGLGRASVP